MHLSRSQWNLDLGKKNQKGLKNNSLQLENLFFQVQFCDVPEVVIIHDMI
jgi:hypothetical protein